jgi:sugar lactone lactonase YvrE
LALLAATAVLTWTALAGGTQPYDTYQATIAGDGPVAQYRFDDVAGSSTLADSAGSDTATNSGITLAGEGPFGGSKSGSFSGAAFATLSSSPLEGATAFTAEAWVNWTGGTSYNQSIFDFGSSSTNYMSLTPASSATGHKMVFELHTGGTTLAQVSATKLTAAVWRYVAVTEGAGKLTLYVNGEQVAQTSASFSPSYLGSLPNDYLGKSHASGEPLFAGSMSNVAFYNKALSASQLAAHYNAAEYPVNTVAPTITGTPRDGSTLTAKAGTWTGLTPITFAYQWTRCAASGTECANIGSATAIKYEATHEDVGKTLRVGVTATNSSGSGTKTSAQTAVVEALKPANTVLPTISGTAKVGQLLSVTNGAWEGTPPISYTYQWQTCTTAGTSCKAISGATSSSYRVISSQVGKTLRVVVTAANSAGSTNATTAITSEVTPGAPANVAPPAISGTARDGQTLTATSGSWAGTEPITYAYQWRSCNGSGEGCSDIAGATSSSYGLSPSNVGSTLRVTVTATNSVGSTSATSAATASVTAIPPANTAAPTISGTPQDGQTLTASNGTWTGTPTLTYAYQWERCDGSGASCSDVTGATSATYGLGAGDVGRTIRVVVTATNAGGSVSSTSTTTTTVSALAPSNTTPPTISGTPQDGHTLAASTGSWTGTPTLSYTYQWRRCDGSGGSCANVSGSTSPTYVLGHEDVGSTLRVVVTATNAGGSAASTSGATATVAALPPSNTASPQITGTAQDGQTLATSAGTWVGTPPLTYAHAWQSCDSLGESCMTIAGATSSTYSLGPSDVGTTLRVIVTATNSAGSSSASSAPSGVVAGTVPSNTGPPTISGTAQAGATLMAAAGSWAGTPPISYAYAWQSCDNLGESCQAIAGATASTYSLGPSDVGTTLRVIVTATNSAGSSSASSAPSGVVTGAVPSNTGPPTISGTAQEGKTLTASAGTWTGASPISYTYQWQSCNGFGEGCLNAANGVGSTYRLRALDVGTVLRVVVTASNSLGSASSTSQTTAVVAPAATYISTFGSAGSGDGQFNHPGDVVLDGKGHVFVVDHGNNRIEEFTEAGEYLRQFGSGVLSGPDGAALDSNGDVWVVDTGNHRVVEFNESGAFLRTVGSDMLGSAEGIAVDRHDDVWVSDTYNARLVEFDSAGEYMRAAGTGQLLEPEGLAYADEHVWVADWRAKVYEFDEEGQLVRQFGEPGSGEGALEHPYGIAVDAGGDVWVADVGGNRIKEFGDAGNYLAQINAPGSGVGHFNLSYPIGLAAGGDAALWLTDASNNRVEKWSLTPVTVAPSNTAPPSISGGTFAGETVSASRGEWEGTAPISYTYQWQRCDASGGECANISGATGVGYILAGADVGFTVRVVVTAANTAGSTTADSPTTGVIVAPTPPSNTALPAISGTSRDGHVLRATSGTWTGTPTPTYVYRWESCNQSGDECAEIEGATGSTYTLSEGDLETTLRFVVTATNAAGSVQAVSASSPEIKPGAPSEFSTPSINGVLNAGHTLSADPGTWGGDEVELTYQWERCSATGGPCADIMGANQASYTLVAGDVGTTARVRIGVSNAVGSVTALSSETPTIGASSVLENTLPPSISGSAQRRQILTASNGSWIGEDMIGSAAQWQRCDRYGLSCEDLEEEASPTYSPTGSDVGGTIRALITAVSPVYGKASAVSPPTQPIAAEGAPVSSVAPVIVGTGLPGETLDATAGTWSGVEPISISYEWVRCDAQGEACSPIAGATDSSYTLTGADVDSTVRAIVTATGSGGSTEAPSYPVTVSSSAIANRVPPSISGSDQAEKPLNADTGIWTGAGAIDYSYEWQRCDAGGGNCVMLAGASASSYTPREGDAGSTLKVIVTATSALGSASVGSAPTPPITSEPVAPENTAEPTLGGNATAGDTLTANPGIWVGSEPIAYGYQWQRCDAEGQACTNIEGALGETYVLGAGDVGSTVLVQVSASNSVGSTTASSYQSEVIGAPGPPVNTATPLIQGVVKQGERIFAGNGQWSGSRPLKYVYGWERCAASGEGCAPIGGASAPSYAVESVDAGASLRVKVTATNTLGSVSATSPTSLVDAPGGSSSQALEAVEQTDPSLIAPSTTASLEGQTVTPATSDPGEELHSNTALTSSSVSKETPGEFAVNTSDGQVSFTPVNSAPGGATATTIVNDTAALFPETSHATDTIVRPAALGAATLLQLRSADAPRSFSWEVGIGPDQHIERLADGSVVVTEPAPGTVMEGTLPEESLEPAESEPTETEEEGVGSEAAEEELEGALGENQPLEKLAAAPRVTTPPITPAEGELHPQDTQAQYDTGRSAIESAQAETGGTTLVVIEPPRVMDSAGVSVPASLSVSGGTVTMTLSPSPSATFPVTAEASVAAPSDEASTAAVHKAHVGFSDPHAATFTPFDANLKSGPLKIGGRARLVLSYNAPPSPALDGWIEAVKKEHFQPFITLAACEVNEFTPRCPPEAPKIDEYRKDVYRLMKVYKGKVGIWGAWNEPGKAPAKGKPGDGMLGKAHAARAALFWKVARATANRVGCCTVVAGEFAQYTPYVVSYARALRRIHAFWPHLPHVWGLHDYHDPLKSGEVGHFVAEHARDLRTVESSALGHPRLWISESGVLLTVGGKKTPLAGEKGPELARQRIAAKAFRQLGEQPHIEWLYYYLYKSPEKAKREKGIFDDALLETEPKAPQYEQRETYCILAFGGAGCPTRIVTNAPVVGATRATASTVGLTVEPRGVASQYWVEYGSTTSYGQSTASTAVVNPDGAQTETVKLSGLQSCTTYHYQAEAVDPGPEGTPSVGGDRTFTTSCSTGAVINDPNCESSTLPANDDQSTGSVTLPFSLDFYGNSYGHLYVNNNGNVTFDNPYRHWTPFPIATSTFPIIAPYIGDVDTRLPESGTGGGGTTGQVKYGSTTYGGRPAFCVDWPHVGYYYKHSDRLNDFQLLLVGRDDISPGAFDIIFNYDQVQWETGDYDHGLDGLFGESAAVGFSSGSGTPGAALEFPGSLENGAFLDANLQSGLIYGEHESGTPGSYVFPIRPGA